jgi:hypothetical protein
MADELTFTWERLTGSLVREKYIVLNGHKDALVRTEMTPQGFLWQYRKDIGYADTVEKAKAWVESLAEHHSIPAADRWLQI